MFPAAGSGNLLVIQSRSSITDGTGTSFPRYLLNSAHGATTHVDNDDQCQKIHAANTNAGDIQSRILYKKLVQVDLYKKLARVSCFLVQVFSCTRILHPMEQSCIRCKKLANTWPKLRDVIGWLVCWVLTVDDLLFCCCVICHCFFYSIQHYLLMWIGRWRKLKH